MLRSTFCHLPGIGLQTEKRIWSCGLHSWQDLLDKRPAAPPYGEKRRRSLQKHVEHSIEQLQQDRADFFARMLPAAQHWRLFAEFRHSTAYLDIETTGMGSYGDHITTIALYDGKSIFYFVKGHNLQQFKQQISRYRLLVTYNGKSFDLPFIRNTMKIDLDQAHIDLRHVLANLGYRGGLKGCERQLGIDRAELDGIDGYFAVLLWNEYVKKRNQKALETLLAYNIQDVVNLERLMIIAYNQKLRETPFSGSHCLAAAPSPQLPFQADMATVERIRSGYSHLNIGF